MSVYVTVLRFACAVAVTVKLSVKLDAVTLYVPSLFTAVDNVALPSVTTNTIGLFVYPTFALA